MFNDTFKELNDFLLEKLHTVNSFFENLNIEAELIVALGEVKHLEPEINRIYSKNESEYFKSYFNSEFRLEKLFFSFTTEKEQRLQKIAGIVLSELKKEENILENNNSYVLQLIKKGYRESWNYFKKNRKEEVIDLDAFVTIFPNKKGKSESIVNRVIYSCIVLIFLCAIDDKGVDISEKLAFGIRLRRFDKSIEDRLKESKRIENHSLDKTFFETFKEKIGLKQQSYLTLEKIYEYVIKQRQSEVDKNLFIKPDETEKHLGREGLLRYFILSQQPLHFFEINDWDLLVETKFSKKELENIFKIIHFNYKKYNLDEKELDMYLVFTLYLIALVKEYKHTREKFINPIQEKYLATIEQKKREYEDALNYVNDLRKELNRNLEKNKSKEKEFNKTIEQLRIELNKKDKEINRLKQLISQSKKNKKELIALREYMFNEQTKNDFKETENDINTDEINKIIHHLSQLKIAVAGGHIKWQRKLKEKLPNIYVIDIDRLNQNLSYIDKFDLIIYNTAVNSHSFYEKFINRMERNDVQLIYLNSQSNINITLKEIYKQIKNQL